MVLKGREIAGRIFPEKRLFGKYAAINGERSAGNK